METRDKVAQILLRIKDQTDELLDNEMLSEMTAEEIVVLATELVTSTPVTTIEYGTPIATVDRSQVSLMLDEEFEFPLYGEKYYEED